MLELTEIQYMAGEKTVLQNVTAGFPAGQVTGIVGPNGAGKSSLLRIASGLVAASGGDIAAAGAFADTAWRARNIAYMPQFQTVAWPLRARE
ncbi:MAG: heme ABC transporter ATP-binding protein, partial [Rhodobiaceae bacterium]|nr:heme ABC transporter ATP-binding protein [Rhodobiaceae bacterium]